MIPAISRAVDVMDRLAHHGSATIAQLTTMLRIPRSTVYRVLNTLEASALVVRNADGTYRLGPHLVRLARSVRVGSDIVELARPHLEALAASLGMAAKLTVLADGEALVAAVVEGREAFTVSTRVGRRFPLHAGAASKALLAWLPEAEIARVLAGPLEAFTEATITDPAVLAQELRTIRAQGIAEDRSEFFAGVHAVAAPVLGPDGACLAAVSVPFLAQTPALLVAQVREAVPATAATISRAAGGGPVR